MSGYLQFYGESDVVSEVAERLNSAGNAYHHTEYWSDADDGEKSQSDMIQDALNSADARIATLESENATLSAKVEGMRAYAERYKWLREHSWVEILFEHSIANFGPGYSQCKPEELDAAIDAARKEASNG